jgi:hypothetical protein
MDQHDDGSILAPSVDLDARAPSLDRDGSADNDADTYRAIASSIYSADDPLAVRPPVGESAAERQARLQAEAHARRVSNEIDAQIKKERREKKKAGKEVKVSLAWAGRTGGLAGWRGREWADIC